jgi:hypothetical protein
MKTKTILFNENHISLERKAAHLQTKLTPYLNIASAEARRDMFLTFIVPLFSAALILLEYEPSQTNQESLTRQYKGLFKSFCRVAKNTSSTLVEEMLGKNLLEVARIESEVSQIKWEARKEGREYEKFVTEKRINTLKGIPNQWIELINTQYKTCPICKQKGQTAHRWHMKYKHKIILPNILAIWAKEILPISTDKNNSREEINYIITPVIEQHLNSFKQAVQSHLHSEV